jgi:hypothetical protein
VKGISSGGGDKVDVSREPRCLFRDQGRWQVPHVSGPERNSDRSWKYLKQMQPQSEVSIRDVRDNSITVIDGGTIVAFDLAAARKR